MQWWSALWNATFVRGEVKNHKRRWVIKQGNPSWSEAEGQEGTLHQIWLVLLGKKH